MDHDQDSLLVKRRNDNHSPGISWQSYRKWFRKFAWSLPAVIFLNSVFNKGEKLVKEVETNWWLPWITKSLENIKTNEPRHDIINTVTVCPTKTQISLGIRPVWSVLLSPWRKLGSLTLIRLGGCPGWSLSLRWAHTHFVGLSCRSSNLCSIDQWNVNEPCGDNPCMNRLIDFYYI